MSPYPARSSRGFTLIELMMVVTIIGLLAAIAIPATSSYLDKARMAEGRTLAEPVQKAVLEYYDRWGVLPATNQAAGLPPPSAYRSKWVDSITVGEGSVEIRLSQQFKADLALTSIYLRPVVPIQNDQPATALLWVCNEDTDNAVPAGYRVAGVFDKNRVRKGRSPC